mmetsp:Transcript_55076/g.146927  ORF Transcript_55076/g.146927 Transcript_55076/m.146927 type:complete len:206 (+) Transcript_55076:981-1598(+)
MGGRDLGPKGRYELVEILRDRQAHAPRAVLGRVLDDRDRVLHVLFWAALLGDHQSGVDARDADRVLGVLLGELLVDADHVAEDRLLLAHGHEVVHPVGRGAPHHRRVVQAEAAVRLPEAGPLVLVGVLVGGRQERAGGHARREEVDLRGQPVHRGHQVLRHELRALRDDLAQRLNGLLPDDRLLLCCEVLERCDEELLMASDVVG